jgi:S1-C subfamily serine protease
VKFFVSLAILAACACAHLGTNSLSAKGEAQEPVYALELSGPEGFGHGCPLSPTTLLTAAHVMLQAGSPLRGFGPAPLRWRETPSGVHGVVVFLDRDPAADLAVMRGVDGGPSFTRSFPLAASAPKVGEMLSVIGYDWRRKTFFSPRVWKLKFVGESAGHLFVEGNPGPGSSGACVLNEAGEVVGINIAWVETDDMSPVGIGVAVFGDWLPSSLVEGVKEERRGAAPRGEERAK